LQGKIEENIPADNPNQDTPIFMGHGDADPLVKYDWGLRTAEALRDMDYKVDFHTYKGLEHSAEPEEMDDVEAYIQERLPPLHDGEKPSSTTTTD
jgi:predicted esterase